MPTPLALALILSASSLFAGMPAQKATLAATQRGSLEQLTQFMTGSFASTEQAKADPKNYLDIRLEVVRIWPERTDGVWLYVEQAVADSLAKPYRQRVYHLEALPGKGLQSTIYTFKKEPLNYAGAWSKPEALKGVTLDVLETRKGCAVFLTVDGSGNYTGSTHAQDCESSLRGATYATTEVSITETAMISWDRGFDAAGKQVWGATKGGYLFKKLATR
jgi:hypothetical protein